MSLLGAVLHRPIVLPSGRKDACSREDRRRETPAGETTPREADERHEPKDTPSSEPQKKILRFYHLAFDNLTSRTFSFKPAPKAAVGRIVKVASQLKPGLTVVAVQALFDESTTCGGMLEMPLSFQDTDGNGLTVRVHCHDKSLLRCDAIGAGQNLQISSAVARVPRLVAQPPLGYDAQLGIYAEARRDESTLVGRLAPGDAVVAAGEKRGRWMQISAPCEGWVIFETRDGSPCFAEEAFRQPHVRQTVTVQDSLRAIESCRQQLADAELSSLCHHDSRRRHIDSLVTSASSQRGRAQHEFSAKNAELERRRLLGRTGQSLAGVF